MLVVVICSSLHFDQDITHDVRSCICRPFPQDQSRALFGGSSHENHGVDTSARTDYTDHQILERLDVAQAR